MNQNYSIISKIREGVEIFSLVESESVIAQIAPQLGNNCFSFTVQEPVLEEIDFKEFIKKPTSFGIPILFPFPNRLRDGEFDFRNKHYKVDPPRHGFVRDKLWKVIDQGASDQQGAWIKSSIDASDYSEQILSQFPFPFRVELTYRLLDSTLTIETVIENRGEQDMPAGFGIHPYFRKPRRGTLQVPVQKRWELVDSLPTGLLVALEGDYDLSQSKSLDRLELDDIFTDVISTTDSGTQCILSDDENRTETIIEFDARQFPNVVVYTPPAPREAICIEPNTCPTDAFNLYNRGIDSNVIVLRGGEKMAFRISIYSRRQGAEM